MLVEEIQINFKNSLAFRVLVVEMALIKGHQVLSNNWAILAVLVCNHNLSIHLLAGSGYKVMVAVKISVWTWWIAWAACRGWEIKPKLRRWRAGWADTKRTYLVTTTKVPASMSIGKLQGHWKKSFKEGLKLFSIQKNGTQPVAFQKMKASCAQLHLVNQEMGITMVTWTLAPKMRRISDKTCNHR